MYRFLAAGLLMCCGHLVLAAECESSYQQHRQSDLSLSYQAFALMPDQGFKALASMGCEKQAADLIQIYINANDAEQFQLYWEIAQLRALHGDYDQAIDNANRALLKKEDFASSPLRWNDFVLATVGFLEQDMAKLSYHRDRVAVGKDEHPRNLYNLRTLDNLIKYFNYNYRYATSNFE